MYTIKSTSEEGVFYLVNHWERHKAFWEKPEKIRANMLFSSPQYARASLTKLLKVMPEYAADKFELIEINA